jgi:hypothetical protein
VIPRDPELLDLVLQSGAFYAEPCRCATRTPKHSSSFPKNLDDVLSIAVSFKW